MISYKDLPGSSRVWIYQSSREFTSEEVEIIKSKGKEFLETWNSHGAALHAALEIFYDRFIAIFVDEHHASASGCSIDKTIHFLKQVEKDFNISLFDRMKVAYKNNGKISTFNFIELEKHLSGGEINENTIVFNNIILTKKEFQTHWEIPLKDSWIKERLISSAKH